MQLNSKVQALEIVARYCGLKEIMTIRTLCKSSSDLLNNIHTINPIKERTAVHPVLLNVLPFLSSNPNVWVMWDGTVPENVNKLYVDFRSVPEFLKEVAFYDSVDLTFLTNVSGVGHGEKTATTSIYMGPEHGAPILVSDSVQIIHCFCMLFPNVFEGAMMFDDFVDFEDTDYYEIMEKMSYTRKIGHLRNMPIWGLHSPGAKPRSPIFHVGNRCVGFVIETPLIVNPEILDSSCVLRYKGQYLTTNLLYRYCYERELHELCGGSCDTPLLDHLRHLIGGCNAGVDGEEELLELDSRMGHVETVCQLPSVVDIPGYIVHPLLLMQLSKMECNYYNDLCGMEITERLDTHYTIYNLENFGEVFKVDPHIMADVLGIDVSNYRVELENLELDGLRGLPAASVPLENADHTPSPIEVYEAFPLDM